MSADCANETEEVASDWLVRRTSKQWTEADQARFEQWLDASTLNRVAFLRLERAWEEAARLKALGAGIHGDQPPTPGQWNLSPFFDSPQPETARPRRRAWQLAIAATVLLAVGSATYFSLFARGDRYATPVGGIASVPMADGSKVTLNTNSQIQVAVSDTERRVELKRGEAFFEVSKDPKRPFVVYAGSKRIVAVGTKFSVRRDANDVQVVVTEGKVRVEETSSAVEASRQGGSTEVVLTPGSIARAGDAGVLVQRKSVPEAETQLSWRAGVLTFRDQSLADAAAEFNRYNQRKIVIDDAAVAELKVEGNFRANNVEAFVRLLESGFPVRASVDEDRIVLTSR